jgi:hypothetical protein
MHEAPIALSVLEAMDSSRGRPQLLLAVERAMRRHNRALYNIIQQHMTVSQLAASGRPMNRSPVFPSITPG